MRILSLSFGLALLLGACLAAATTVAAAEDAAVAVDTHVPLGQQLYEAAEKGSPFEVSQILLTNPEVDLTWTNTEFLDWTPLHTAVANGHIDVVRVLLSHPNIDVNTRKAVEGTSVLSWAVYQRLYDIVELLLHDARVDVNQANDNDFTPMVWAVHWGNSENFELLIGSGRELEMGGPDRPAADALAWAAKRRKPVAAQWIQDYKIDPQAARVKARQARGITGKAITPTTLFVWP